MRSWAPSLLGLFLIAQIAGVVPLLALHAADAFEQTGMHHDHGDASALLAHRHADHQKHAGDARDECCAVHHHLAGVLPHALNAVHIAFVTARMTAPAAAPAESAFQTLPERPPKVLPSI